MRCKYGRFFVSDMHYKLRLVELLAPFCEFMDLAEKTDGQFVVTVIMGSVAHFKLRYHNCYWYANRSSIWYSYNHRAHEEKTTTRTERGRERHTTTTVKQNLKYT